MAMPKGWQGIGANAGKRGKVLPVSASRHGSVLVCSQQAPMSA